jgi:hypothetical protein
MTDSLVTSIVTILTAIIGLAILAVLVSPRAQTSNVIGAGARGVSSILGAALSPVTSTGAFGFTGAGPGIGINFG